MLTLLLRTFQNTCLRVLLRQQGVVAKPARHLVMQMEVFCVY